MFPSCLSPDERVDAGELPRDLLRPTGPVEDVLAGPRSERLIQAEDTVLSKTYLQASGQGGKRPLCFHTLTLGMG